MLMLIMLILMLILMLMLGTGHGSMFGFEIGRDLRQELAIAEISLRSMFLKATAETSLAIGHS
jgi:hypothetical protein